MGGGGGGGGGGSKGSRGERGRERFLVEEGRAIGRVKEGGVLGGWRRSSWWRREEQLVE